MTMLLQFVFKPLPGSDLSAIVTTAKEAARLWKKHGAADASLWTVAVGEMGNLAFTVHFEDFTSYGTCYDSLLKDADFRKWQMDVVKQGMTEWVRGSVARKMSLD